MELSTAPRSTSAAPHTLSSSSSSSSSPSSSLFPLPSPHPLPLLPSRLHFPFLTIAPLNSPQNSAFIFFQLFLNKTGLLALAFSPLLPLLTLACFHSRPLLNPPCCLIDLCMVWYRSTSAAAEGPVQKSRVSRPRCIILRSPS